jgi:hypothetical protein
MGVKFTIDDVRRATYLARERRETTLRLALEIHVPEHGHAATLLRVQRALLAVRGVRG